MLTSTVTHPLSLPEYVAWYGLKDAASVYGSSAVINWVLGSAGASVCVSGQLVILLPKKIDPNTDANSDPNKDPNSRPSAFDQIIDDEELFRQWFKHKHPVDRVYDETEALEILRGYHNHLGGGHMRADPPDEKGIWEWHLHDPERNVRISITKEAFDLLKKLGF